MASSGGRSVQGAVNVSCAMPCRAAILAIRSPYTPFWTTSSRPSADTPELIIASTIAVPLPVTMTDVKSLAGASKTSNSRARMLSWSSM